MSPLFANTSGKALEKYNLAWLEDMIPWQYPELLKEIKQHVNIPLNTGEDIYLKENFVKLASVHATDILHPDLATSGGILETHKIGDAIEEHGVPMAMHFAGSPVSCMANMHCAAATNNFLVMENHSVDVPWWSDLAEGLPKPIVEKGSITVPEKPGLGLTLNEDAVKQHLRRARSSLRRQTSGTSIARMIASGVCPKAIPNSGP